MITETQLLAQNINTWFNTFSTENADKYDILADFNPLENERVDSTLERFAQNTDDMIKQQIESDKIRAVVKTSIAPYNPVQGVYAVTTNFTVNFWLNIKTNAQDVIEDIYDFIFNSTDGQYNGKVTKTVVDTTTYSIAWGFNKPTAFQKRTLDGTVYQQVSMTGTTTITAEDATKGISALYFGDNFILSLTGQSFTKTQVTGVASIEPIYNSQLKQKNVDGLVKPYISLRENDMVLVYPFRKNDPLALHFLDVVMGEIKAENYEVELKLIDGETTVKTYTWSNTTLAGERSPLQLGEFPALSMTLKKA